MKTIPGKEFCRFPERNGSHHLYNKPGNPVLICVPVHGNQPLKKGILKALLQKAELLDKI
jgi:predicted RNA binding protein YcfA (HicA-like mRNA interferase family)